MADGAVQPFLCRLCVHCVLNKSYNHGIIVFLSDISLFIYSLKVSLTHSLL